MSFLGHPVCHLGLNWCILWIIYCFSALAIMLVLSVFPWETNKVNNAFKISNSHAYKIKYYKCSQKWHYGKLLGFWGHYTVYFVFCLQNVFICYYCFYFLPFPDKNPWFSSQRRREGVVGDANSSISK